MKSAYNHLLRLYNWNQFFLGKPATYYPNQLVVPADLVTLNAALQLLATWKAALGAIPSR